MRNLSLFARSVNYYAMVSRVIFCLIIFTAPAIAQSLEVNEVKFLHKDKKSFEDDILSDAVGITKAQLYNQSVLLEDVLKLKKFYFDNGFYNVKVDTSVIYNFQNDVENDVNVDVNFLITENRRYRIDSLVYKGIEKISPDLKRLVDSIKTIKERDYYNKVLIIQQTNEILDLLQNNGYMNAAMKKDSGTLIIKHDTSASAVIYFEGTDSLFRFGKTKINIEKNVYSVDEGLLTKVISYKEGDIYSKAEKLTSERNMSQYAIVQSARLVPSAINNGTVDFTANVLLNKKNEVTPYAEGTNIDNKFYFGGGVKYLNKYFWGGGRVFTIELHGLFNTYQVNRFELIAGVTQPNIFNTHSSLTDKIVVGLYNLEGFKNYFAGNLTTINYFFSSHTFYNNASLALDEEMVWFKYDIDSTGTLTQFNSFLVATIVHDNTNNPASPSAGFYHSISVGDAGLIPRLVIRYFNKNVYYSQFVKLFTSNRFYFDISKMMSTLVFATSFKIGDIMEYGSGDRISAVQPLYRFFSGGSNSLRGWNAKQNGVLANRLAGGEFLVEGSLELRKKLFPKSASFTKSIGAALFLDYGNVWETHKEFRFDQIAMAIGFGLRYDLFIGPVRVDLGFKLYDPTDRQNEKWLFNNFSRLFKDKFAVTFGIGQAF